MSTRAMIAVPTAKGYKTAWCWCNGFPDQLGKTLRAKFTTREFADELVNHHSFEGLNSKKEKEKFEHDFPESDGWFEELSKGTFLLKYSHQGKTVAGRGKYGFFREIKKMLEQDLNYVYVFDDGRWVMHK